MRNTAKPQRMQGVDDMAEWFRTTPAGIYALRAKGSLPPAYRVGGRLLWDADEVAAWLSQQRDDSKASA